ncbi:MAG: glycosyltransferase family 4 protein [Candidatus Daviesbacteria bacterium]|nr:glycosyltransferase family 4 protein [Candidatus Daviesbacteria bacterium]
MKIGIITHNYPLYKGQSKDAGKFIYGFAHILSSKVDKVFVLCPNYEGEKEKYKDIPVTWFSWIGGSKKLGNLKKWNPLSWFLVLNLLLSGQKATVEFVKTNKIDYLIVFWNFPGGVFAWYANKKLAVPYVTWALGSDIFVYGNLPIAKILISLVLKNATFAFGNSINICQTIENKFRKKSVFLPTSNLLLTKNSSAPKLNKNKFNFLYVGRLELVKGPDVLLDAIEKLSKKRRDFQLYMIGEGSMADWLNSEFKKRNLGELVSLLGYVEDQKVVNGFFMHSDCLVIPSRSESFPLVITEALQASLPMIGSDVGDMPLFIPKNKLGFIFKKEDSDDLANVMDRMIKSGSKIKNHSKVKMKELANKFNLDNIVDDLLYYINT